MRRGEDYFCAMLVEAPGKRLSKPFASAPAHTTAANAFNERLHIAIDFVEEHDPTAILVLRRWSPIVTLAE